MAWQSASGLTLLDHDGKNTAEISGTFLKHWASSNGSAIAVLEKAASAKDGNDQSSLILRWFDRDGRQMGRHNFLQHSDDPLPQISFNATGSHLVVAQPAIARLIFLNNNGQTLRESFIFSEAPYSQERPFFIAASAEAFVVLSQFMPSTSSDVVAPVCMSFSTSGEEQWRRELPAGAASGLAVSDDGELIVASRYLVHVAENGSRVESTISLLQRDGKLLANVDGLFRKAVFTQDNTRLLLMDRRQLRALEIPSGKVLWQVNLSRRAEMFVDIAANAEQDKVFALVGSSVFKENRFVFENARLLGFDDSGRQQFELPMKTTLSSPILVISEDGQQLTLAAEGWLQNFTILDSTK
ncbi:PQQ-like beta-propeller repeat protein [candidate division KSB1 bacterium]|nr:PQQ-like beta-propeller repeat protein [candidate division KSB1 bacterium]